jgi:hypothetical protein
LLTDYRGYSATGTFHKAGHFFGLRLCKPAERNLNQQD